MRRIVYDCTLRRPGCVILQSIMGGDVGADVLGMFRAPWLTEPTPDMKVYEVSEAQLEQLRDMEASSATTDRTR